MRQRCLMVQKGALKDKFTQRIPFTFVTARYNIFRRGNTEILYLERDSDIENE